jgi:L-amino acid N-acyltransferase YncA
MNFAIQAMTGDDGPAVLEIYRQGIATRNATFETETPVWEKWNAGHLPHSRLVARDGTGVLGWAALSPVSNRRVYAGVAEVSIYIADESRGRGIGRALLEELIRQSEKNGMWTLQAGIFPENVASIRLHKALGFREVGRRERIGKLGDEWRDTVLLERRSKRVGSGE